MVDQKVLDLYYRENYDGIDYRVSNVGVEWDKIAGGNEFELNEKDKKIKREKYRVRCYLCSVFF